MIRAKKLNVTMECVGVRANIADQGNNGRDKKTLQNKTTEIKVYQFTFGNLNLPVLVLG